MRFFSKKRNIDTKEKHVQLLQKLYTIFGVLCVAALFGAAMLFPRYYSRLYDKKTLDQASFTDISVSTYETSYDSFVGKLYALAKASNESREKTDKGMIAVRTNELNMTMDKGELTKIVRRELKKLHELNVLVSELKPKTKSLTQYERYTIYTPQEAGSMKGISCWKFVYENSKRIITLYLDEEYHKIYSLDIYYKKDGYSTVSVQHMGVSQKTGVSKSTEIYDSSVIDDKGIAFDGLIKYYDIDSYQEGSYDIWLNGSGSSGTVEFDGQYTISVFKILFSDGQASRYWIGIPFEKMIQF